MSSNMTDPCSDFPESVEEAGALLSAAIMNIGKQSFLTVSPPSGMHSSFGTTQVLSRELVDRLYALRALLRSSQAPLVAAPSLLAVLIKLIHVSTTLAAAATTTAAAAPVANRRTMETPPLLSTPLRKLWVDCVVLCHVQGQGLVSHKVASPAFLRTMLMRASEPPKGFKAGGGVRTAALEVVAGMLQQETLSPQLAPWSLEILQCCLKALRSSGNGEPTFRVAAVQCASACAIASRQAQLRSRPGQLILPTALEDKAIYEAVRVLKQAASDKFPEVRSAAASYAGLLAPLLQLTGRDIPPLHALEDVVQVSMKNLDDESPQVSMMWAHALSRCLCTALQYHALQQANTAQERNQALEQTANSSGSSSTTARIADEHTASRFGRAKLAWTHHSSSALMLQHLVDHFGRVGGELAAARMGGTFSTGGRAVRIGLANGMVQLLRLQSAMDTDDGLDTVQVVGILLDMVGDEVEQQWTTTEASSTPAPLFGHGLVRNRSPADPALARLAAGRVLREGLVELATEPQQLTILQALIELLPEAPASKETSSSSSPQATPKRPSETGSSSLNSSQLQVVLIEISHLLATLGEATASKIENLQTRLNVCLAHEALGVRHEAAIACAALTASFPSHGRKLLRTSLDDIQYDHAQMVTVLSTKGSAEEEVGGLRMFRRSKQPSKPSKQSDPSLPHQQAIHGRSLMVSILTRDLPHLPGGLPSDLLGTVLSVAEILVSCQFNETMTSASPGGACMCARAGFGMISGVLTTGPDAVAPHIALVFGAWQRACSEAKKGGNHLAPRHDLFCLDSALSSVVAFLKYCPQLLLSIPDALSRTTVMLEEVLQLFMPEGRIGSIQLTPPVAARLETATASLLEAFAFLPSGSFPMAADAMFTFAARYIRDAVENEITCSILHSLVNREDHLLDSKTLSRAKSDGQVGGARGLEETIITLTMEAVHHSEREAMLHLLDDGPMERLTGDEVSFRGSAILGLYVSDNKEEKPPTPLHEVGTWRRPIDPSTSSKVRLVDAAIQAFAATFGLKSGNEQMKAMVMLETLVPPFLAQLARTIGVNSTLIEQDRRSKAKEDSAAVANITAVLLSCLKSLPLHEATHNVPIGLGPPWMNKAKDLLLTLLPSASNVVRRAAAEGLALLATLGVTEDAHFLQSTVLHSLDEVMQGNKPDGRPRTIALEPVSAARAGSLLTLACIQRTASVVAKKQQERARGRSEKMSTKADDELPLLQMMTRILPSATCHGFKDYFVVRTYALHSFAVLLAYSGRLDKSPLNDDDLQLLRKGVELVEGNFVASWTAASLDVDRGQEAEKMTSEIAFLVVLLRLMSFLVPSLRHLQSEDPGVARRFSLLATIILECHGSHPVVTIEAMAFFEVLASHQQLLPSPSKHVEYTENSLFSCIPFILRSLTPDRPALFAEGTWKDGYVVSIASMRCTVYVVRILSLSQISVVEWTDMKVVSLLLASLEAICGAQFFTGCNLIRSLAAPRESELLFAEDVALEDEICCILPVLLLLERFFHEDDTDRYLRWTLLARALLANASTAPDTSDTDEIPEYSRAGVIQADLVQAASDAEVMFETANPLRWQVRCIAAQLAVEALDQLSKNCREKGGTLVGNPHFDLAVANKTCRQLCHEASENGCKRPRSQLVFHLDDLLSAACTSTVSTLDQAELFTLQASSMPFLEKLIACFARIRDPEQPSESILEQSTTQIFAAVKHALGSPGESDSEAALRLFLAGCEALQVMVQNELTTDPMTLKRVIRPIVPPKEETQFFSYSEGYPVDLLLIGEDIANINTQISVLPRVGRIWTTGKLLLSEHGDHHEFLEEVSRELVNNEKDVAVHCAAIAIDGARLLLGSDVSLVGQPLTQKDKKIDLICDCGFLFTNTDDISDAVKAALAVAWSSCASSALKPLLACAMSETSDEETRDACTAWIDAVVPLLFAGVLDAMSRNGEDSTSIQWARGLDAAEIEVDCLRGIVTLVKDAPTSMLESKWNDDIESVVAMCLSSVFIPVLKRPATSESDKETKTKAIDAVVVEQACSLFRQLATSKADADSKGSVFLVSVLTPLDMLQNGEVHIGDRLVEMIISTCLTAMCSLIAHGMDNDLLVKAMLQLVLKTLITSDSKIPETVQGASKLLLHACLDHKTISLKERQRIACEAASKGNWDAWAVVSTTDDGVAISASFSIVQARLQNFEDPDLQVRALSALCKVIQSAPIPSLLVGRIISGVGDVMATFYQYGTLKVPEVAHAHRQTACAESMKLMLLAYQQVSQDGFEDEQVAAFLSLLFDTLLAVLRFNGLPNHPSPTPGGDQALGRMCAQAILRVARTTPVAFKSSMGGLSDHDRALMEFAVRAEMSGYAVEGQQPAKKKLNIRSFQ